MKKLSLEKCKQMLTELNGVEPEIWFVAKNKGICIGNGAKPYGFVVNVIGDSFQLIPIVVNKNAYSFLLNDIIGTEAEKRYFINKPGCYELHCKVNGKSRKLEINKKLNQPNINIIKEYIGRTAKENSKMKAVRCVGSVLICVALFSCVYFGAGEFYKLRTSVAIKHAENQEGVNLHCMLKDYDKYDASFKCKTKKYSHNGVSYELPDYLKLTDDEYSKFYKNENGTVIVNVIYEECTDTEDDSSESVEELLTKDKKSKMYVDSCEKYFGIKPDSLFNMEKLMYSFDAYNYKGESTAEAIVYYGMLLSRTVGCSEALNEVYLYEKDDMCGIIKQSGFEKAKNYSVDMYNVSDLDSSLDITILVKNDANIDIEDVYAIINSISY